MLPLKEPTMAVSFRLSGFSRMPLIITMATLGLTATRGAADEKKGDQKGILVTLDGLQSRTPTGWEEGTPTTKMRFKQFKIPGPKKGNAPAELVIFFFGTGQGGSAEDNIARWKTQF